MISTGGRDRALLSFYEALCEDAAIAKALRYLGILYSLSIDDPDETTQDDINKAQKYFRKSLDLTIVIGDNESTATNYRNLGSIEANPVKAIEYLEQALLVDSNLDAKSSIADDYRLLGYHYGYDQNKAHEFFQKALSLDESIGSKAFITNDYKLLASSYPIANGKIECNESVEYLKKALEIDKTTGNSQVVASDYIEIGFKYLSCGKPDMAHEFLNNAVQAAEASDGNQVKLDIYDSLVSYYEFAGDLDKVLDFCKKNIQIRETLDSKQNKNSLLYDYTAVAAIYSSRDDLEELFAISQKALLLANSVG
ncbi:MAG: tetratricopeptide repeat protein, partial [Methylomonas lenta]|nr:tetratricopeptide repeat protein [Methylomonas lenta]